MRPHHAEALKRTGVHVRFADRQIAEFFPAAKCDFVKDYANPFTLFVIADLLGVPEADHDRFPRGAARRRAADATARSMLHQAARVPLPALPALHRGPAP